MFERYTEKARRIVFFARYEASEYGSLVIDTEHLLLGLLREDKALCHRFLPLDASESIRKQIDATTTVREKVPTSVDLPLSNDAKQVLIRSADEADEMGHRNIGPEHVLLGLLGKERCLAAELLRQQGVSLVTVREAVAKMERLPTIPLRLHPHHPQTVEIHGANWDGAYVWQTVNHYRRQPWHWEKKAWAPLDAIKRRGHGTFSLDLNLASSPDFEFVKGGWKQDYCLVCRWELREGDDPQHATGYSNGRDWLCLECYEKFWARRDFFGAGYGDLT